MYTNMTKIISISDEAYEELSKLKNQLSFTQIIIVLTKMKKKESIMEFTGMLTKEEGNKILREIEKGRKEISRRLK